MKTNRCIGGEYVPFDWIDVGRYNLSDTVSPPIKRFDICQEECDTNGFCPGDPSLACAVRHPDLIWQVNYDGFFDKDVAVILLPEPVKDFPLIALNSNPDTPVNDDLLETIGWGLADDDSGDFFFFPNFPYTVNVNYVTNEDCVLPVNGYRPEDVTMNMLCAAAPGKVRDRYSVHMHCTYSFFICIVPFILLLIYSTICIGTFTTLPRQDSCKFA